MAAEPRVPVTPLAIVCGAGRFPLAVAEDVVGGGRPVFLLGVAGSTDAGIERYPHAWLRMGQFGRMIDLAHSAGARDILFVGALSRPASWREVRPDRRLLLLLPKMIRAFRGGDDHLLGALAAEMKRQGFTVRGVHEVAPGLMLPVGVIGVAAATAAQAEDVRFGFEVLAALSAFDVGQGVVVAGKRVLAVEAAEGTDLMLERVATLRSAGRLRFPDATAVFVKAPKQGQDRRMDTPAVGPGTVSRVKAAGIAGIAVAAGEVMAVEAGAMIAAADEAGLFVQGFAVEAR